MARAKNGEAIGPRGRSPSGRKKLRRLIRTALKGNDLDVWRRARAVLGYIEGRRVVDLAADLAVTRGSVNRWLGWARVGIQPRVDTFGMRKTAHIFGALTVEGRPRFHYQFAPVFNAQTFWTFLRLLVRRSRRKIFLIIDNGSGHNPRDSL